MSLSDVIEGAPNIRELLSQAQYIYETTQLVDDRDHDGEEAGHYPIVRSWQ